MFGVFGLPSHPLSYEQFFSLWQNVERVRARQSFEQVRVGSVVKGDGALPDQWIESVVENEQERGKWRLWSLRKGLTGR